MADAAKCAFSFFFLLMETKSRCLSSVVWGTAGATVCTVCSFLFFFCLQSPIQQSKCCTETSSCVTTCTVTDLISHGTCSRRLASNNFLGTRCRKWSAKKRKMGDDFWGVNFPNNCRDVRTTYVQREWALDILSTFHRIRGWRPNMRQSRVDTLRLAGLVAINRSTRAIATLTPMAIHNCYAYYWRHK